MRFGRYTCRGAPAIKRWLLSMAVVALLSACATGSNGVEGSSTGEVETEILQAGPLLDAGVQTAGLTCNNRQIWDPHLHDEAETGAKELLEILRGQGIVLDEAATAKAAKSIKDALAWRLIRTLILGGRYHNLGVLPLYDVFTDEGRPVILFRTGLTSKPNQPGSCFRSLLDAGRVRHVVNLYTGSMPTSDLEAGEQAAVDMYSGTYFLARDLEGEKSKWRELLKAAVSEHGETNPEILREAMKAVAAIIKEQILRPGGEAPRGNIHVHCGGGMHRTGMIVGIIDRCINGATDQKLVADYRRHTAWRSATQTGGYEQANVDFITAFDCSLLK